MKFSPGLRSYFLLMLAACLVPTLVALAGIAAGAGTLLYAVIGIAAALLLSAAAWFLLARLFEHAVGELREYAKTLGNPSHPPRLALPIRELDELGHALVEAASRLAQERARRSAAESAQKRSKSILADVERQASIASWEWDIATGGIVWSDAMYRLFRLTPESGAASRARLISLVHSHDRARAAAWLASLARDEVHQPIEFQILRADGESRIVHCESRQTHDETGNLVKILGTMRDITDMRRLETRLAENSGQAPAPEETVDVASLVGSTVFLAEPLAAQAGVTLDAAVAPDAGEIKCSERALKEILLRMMNHAVARSPQGGQVTIRAEFAAQGGLTIHVSDSGPPFDPDELAKDGVFAMVGALAEGQGGSLRFSGTPDNGLTARLHLPAERVLSKVA
jgi:PAS domain S-box-containing protein